MSPKLDLSYAEEFRIDPVYSNAFFIQGEFCGHPKWKVWKGFADPNRSIQKSVLRQITLLYIMLSYRLTHFSRLENIFYPNCVLYLTWQHKIDWIQKLIRVRRMKNGNLSEKHSLTCEKKQLISNPHFYSPLSEKSRGDILTD
jgi:hypothetical protein